MTDKQKELIRQLYPDHITREICDIVGLRANTINEYALRHGIRHSEETWQRITHNRVSACNKAHTKESYRLAAKAIKAKYQSEMFRLLSGQKKQTRMTISILPPKCRMRMSALCYRDNYFRGDDLNDAVLYYDEHTTRNARSEEYAKKKYGIRFEKA